MSISDKGEVLKNIVSEWGGYTLARFRDDDQFIVAYPRSGMTWLRTMIVNILEPEARGNPDSFNALIPGISIRGAFKINRLHLQRRFISTHSMYNSLASKHIHRCVYLVRDGRDSLVSLYHFVSTRRGKKISFDEFLSKYFQGIYGPPWHVHVESWLGKGKARLGDDMLVVKFEHMRRETKRILAAVVDFLGIDVDEEGLNWAVKYASLDHARRLEEAREGSKAEDETFYRGGKSGKWAEFMAQKQIDAFMAKSESALHLAGYVP